MAETRIRRGGSTRLSSARDTATKGRRGRTLKRQSTLDRVIEALPVSEATLQRLASWAIVGIFGAGVVGVAIFFGVPAMAHKQAALLAARAGFEVDKVEVRGVERMDELPVYNIALGQVDRSMLSLDLPKVRSEMLKLGWIKDARISRRLPDTLVVGPDANRQTAGLNALMDNAPALKPMLAGATWVGNRRWDLRFQSGETLSLPEGDKGSAAALVNFARMDGVNRLLGRGIVKFDMRDPDRFVLRLPQGKVEDKPMATDGKTASAAPAEEEG